MLSFKKITAECINDIALLLRCQSYNICDYTPHTVYMWRNYFNINFCVHDDMLFMKTNNPGFCEERYLFPVGKGDINAALKSLEEYAGDKQLIYTMVPEDALSVLSARYKEKCEIIPEPNWADYIYDAKDLAALSGKKYHGQKNHINYFIREYPDFEYITMTAENTDKVIGFFEKNRNPDVESPLANAENGIVSDFLLNFSKFDCLAGFLVANGEIVAFTEGEVQNETLYIHIEKAKADCRGAYQMIGHSFLSDVLTDDIKYVNREEDCGDAGIRMSKLSYHPSALLKKYTVKVIL